MNATEIRDQLKFRLGNLQGTQLDDPILEAMTFVQETVLEGGNFKPWFLLSTTEQTITATVDQPWIAVPTGFLEEWEDGPFWYYDITQDDPRVPIHKADYEDLKGRYPGTGVPKGYDHQGEAFWLAPTPDVAYEFRFYAFMRDSAPALGVENNWMQYASDVVLYETGKIIAGQVLQDQGRFAIMQSEAAGSWNRLMAQHTAKMEANKRRIMGDFP